MHASFLSYQYKPIVIEGLTDKEIFVAEKINALFQRSQKFRGLSKVFLKSLSESEHFFEMVIRVLSAMIKVGTVSEEASDVQVLCEKVLEVFVDELDFENCSIMLRDPDANELMLIAGRGKSDKFRKESIPFRGRRMKIGEGIAGKVAQLGEYIFVHDIAKDERFVDMPMDITVKSILSLPLKSGGMVIGVINFSHPMTEEFNINKIHLTILLAEFVSHMIALIQMNTRISEWNESLKEEVERKTKELRQKNQELQKLALIDPLTGIYNRRFFFKRIEEQFANMRRFSESFSFLFIDIDNFKAINDTHGHYEGDHILKTLGRILRQVSRSGDVACRLGGDEFGCILIKSDEAGALKFSKRLLERFKAIHFVGLKIKPTLSIGLVNSRSFPFKGYVDMYKAADEALYFAKLTKDCIAVYPLKKIEGTS